MEKYLGETGLTKLISLIKTELKKVVPSNSSEASTGQILTKTSTGPEWADAPDSGVIYKEATETTSAQLVQNNTDITQNVQDIIYPSTSSATAGQILTLKAGTTPATLTETWADAPDSGVVYVAATESTAAYLTQDDVDITTAVRTSMSALKNPDSKTANKVLTSTGTELDSLAWTNTSTVSLKYPVTINKKSLFSDTADSNITITGVAENILHNWYFLDMVETLAGAPNRWTRTNLSYTSGTGLSPTDSTSIFTLAQTTAVLDIYPHTISCLYQLGTTLYCSSLTITSSTTTSFTDSQGLTLSCSGGIFSVSGTGAFCLKACKLEIGETQTLALEDAKTLTEIPNKQEEQFKCQTAKYDSTDTQANKTNFVYTNIAGARTEINAMAKAAVETYTIPASGGTNWDGTIYSFSGYDDYDIEIEVNGESENDLANYQRFAEAVFCALPEATTGVKNRIKALGTLPTSSISIILRKVLKA